MREAAFEECEIQTILFLHNQACLRVGKPEAASNVFLGTGIRQGCSLSATGRFYSMYKRSLIQQHRPY